MSKIQSESNSQQFKVHPTSFFCCDRYVKDTIWKQFTTGSEQLPVNYRLWSVCQRYNLKAIHNRIRAATSQLQVVIGMSKIQSESNSQRVAHTTEIALGCDRYVKDTIWKQFTTGSGYNHFFHRLWSVCQRYNLKAIHNYIQPPQSTAWVVIGMSKIQSESNSQQSCNTQQHNISCDRYVKDTIWKQFTT